MFICICIDINTLNIVYVIVQKQKYIRKNLITSIT